MQSASFRPQAPTFSLLTHLAGDSEQLALYSERSCVESWLAAERALALAQAEHGVLTRAEARSIVGAARYDNVDLNTLWEVARNVGYPVHGLVREVGRSLDPHTAGRMHFGATTQDIMDTGLVLQLVRSLSALDGALGRLGDAVMRKAVEHAHTVMPARTHAQQAVPTTFGTTLATLLAQLTRHRERLTQALPRIGVVELFGAGGTAAAFGPKSGAIRASFARILGLRDATVAWHVERDGIAEFGWLCATITATCAKLARNIVDLSRAEIGEVFEPYADHRGASSTMPQKVNPISSEILIGLSGAAGALLSSLPRIQEAGHERAAGEWQIEWQVVPQLAVLAGSALNEALVIVDGMRVDAGRMRANLDQDSGLVMAEAQMMHIAGVLGHNQAHDMVHEAATRARSRRITLAAGLREVASEWGHLDVLPDPLVEPEDYLGEAVVAIRQATDRWAATEAADKTHVPIARLAVEADGSEIQ
ncbi:MAG: lyase family protein [Nocardiopsaceae bacterium]|nr:lyase family protein [Nocardiopsaceae bacterium]